MSEIFCDFDGVLVNFDKQVSKMLGHDLDHPNFETLPRADKAKILEKTFDTVEFWANMEPMPDFHSLWGYIKYWKPSALTAYPTWGRESPQIAKQGKWQWAKKHLQIPESKFHCVAREDKQKYAINNGISNILIDDHPKNIEEWNNKGGHGIFHTSAVSTITQLKLLGYRK